VLTEFELIRKYFPAGPVRQPGTILETGDDAAVIEVPQGRELAVTTDTLVAGTHFPENTDPYDIGYKSLAVSLSDLAAMGAQPAWALLALTLPAADERWLESFSSGWTALAAEHNVELIGGDTTRGPLSVTVQALGLVKAGRALRRDGARPGDLVYVTGTLGDAALGLLSKQGRLEGLDAAERAVIELRLDRPEPRVPEGLLIRDIATAAIDISDGLAADLGHILEASGTGATIHAADIPLSGVMRMHLEHCGWRVPLAGGDDYELCFTAAPEKRALLELPGSHLGKTCSLIGTIEAGPGLRCIDDSGRDITPELAGYRHF